MSGKESPLRVLVLSDLHFCKSNTTTKSWLVHDAESGMHIWSDLFGLIDREQMVADLVICPGDITTQACEESLEVAWKHLNELRSKLDAPVLATATGNHDVVSRNMLNGPANQRIEQYIDLVENLKLLDPPYPIVLSDEPNENTKQMRVNYFGKDFIIYENQEYRLVVLNSCSRHRDDSVEYNRGSVGKAALKWLEEELGEIDPRNSPKINILICHHHPIRHSEYNLGQFDQMYDGDLLLELLKKYGNWIVIHGHKHHARLVYSQGGNHTIPIFAAGTFSSHKETLGPEFNNQLYLMNIEPATKRSLKGSIKVWDWERTQGWIEGKRIENKVFSGVGFGYRGDIFELADQIESNLEPLIVKPWDDLQSEIPDLNYLVPSDYHELFEELRTRSIEIQLDKFKSLTGIKKVG